MLPDMLIHSHINDIGKKETTTKAATTKNGKRRLTKAKLLYTFKAVESATAPIGRYKALKNVEKVLEATSAPNWSKWLRF